MARIAGIDLPRDKRIEVGLSYIYGIGRRKASDIIKATGVNPDTRVRDLTEEEVSKQLEGIYQKHGCVGNSFEPIVAYGKNGADNHHSGDDSRLKVGDSIVIDIGGLYKGYCSDMTRTVFYKEVSPKQKTVYELVLKAQKAAEAMIKPGVRLCDIDKCARDIIAEGGYTVEFNHRLGHFIGRDVHEWCDVSQNFDLEVQEGMIFSIEPGIYLEGNFGVRVISEQYPL